MKIRNLKHAARALLDVQVPYPAIDPGDPDGPLIETPHRLGSLISGVILDLLGGDAETLAESFGPDWASTCDAYEALCSSLKSLATTGRVDENALKSGVYTLHTVIGSLAKEAEQARAMLDPNAPTNADLHKRAAFSPDQIGHDLQVTYLAYLGFRCMQDGLEILKDGLIEINQSIGQGPPPRPGR